MPINPHDTCIKLFTGDDIVNPIIEEVKSHKDFGRKWMCWVRKTRNECRQNSLAFIDNIYFYKQIDWKMVSYKE